MTTQPTVFLSYAREDRARVEQVYDALKAEGFNPWMDSRSILPGSNWSSAIGQAIRTADFMLAFTSRHSVSKRGYVQREIRSALEALSELPDGSIFLIPVRLDDSELPATLQHIQYVDLFEVDGWKRLLSSLEAGMQLGRITPQPIEALRDEVRRTGRTESLEKRPHIFVAMPFAVEMEDVYYYGIQRAIDANGFASLRIDQTAFTGDILERIKHGIDTSVAAVVELTGLNPNVHLELGYAWGKGIPCVLLLRAESELCFDVRGQRCLTYRRISDLERVLTEELSRLKVNGSIRS